MHLILCIVNVFYFLAVFLSIHCCWHRISTLGINIEVFTYLLTYCGIPQGSGVEVWPSVVVIFSASLPLNIMTPCVHLKLQAQCQFPPASVSLPERLEYVVNKYAEHTHEKWSLDKVIS